MTVLFQIILIFVSIATMAMILQKIRKSKVQIDDALFWLFFSAVLLIFSLFPQLADWLAQLMGIASPVNFIFLLIIFLLMLHQFFLSLKLSILDQKLKELVQTIAMKEKLDHQQEREQ